MRCIQHRIARKLFPACVELLCSKANGTRPIDSSYGARIVSSVNERHTSDRLLASRKDEGLDNGRGTSRPNGKSAANVDDIPRKLFSITGAVPHILVDPQPDSSDRMSRLRITTSERSDLIKMLDSAFGERIAKKDDRPAMEAAAALLREWLTTSGHTPAPE